MYAANVGTFLQRDPLGEIDGQFLGYSHETVTRRRKTTRNQVQARKRSVDPNDYCYVGNNPLRRIDPLGLQSITDIFPGMGWLADMYWYGGAPINSPPPPPIDNSYGAYWYWRSFVGWYVGSDSWILYQRGCIGLCSIRLGDPWAMPNFVADIRCFSLLDDAQALHRQYQLDGLSPIIFAVQSTNEVPTEAGEVPYPSIFIDVSRLGKFNFATALFTENGDIVWEWMNHGMLSNVETPTVRNCSFLPSPKVYPYTVYCVAQTGNPKFPPRF